MKQITTVTFDTDALAKAKKECSTYRVPFSRYLNYILANARPLDNDLANEIFNWRSSNADRLEGEIASPLPHKAHEAAE